MSIKPKDQLSVFRDGAVDLISEADLLAKLERRRPLRIKYGADPSAPDLHLGHTVPLRKLKTLQDLGHKIIFLIGDFTAQIGDPSHRTETRRPLSKKEVAQNVKSYQDQVFRILDRKKTEVRYNSEWLGKLKPDDFLNLAGKYTVARLLERDDFQKRYAAGRPITVLEFLYPLLQGYDSVVLKADLEVGGTDQKFNLLVGRELQRDWRIEAQCVLTLPLIEGTDGKDKMSKSLGNHISIQDDPNDMFGKLMSIPDTLTVKYFRYLGNLTSSEAEQMERDLSGGGLHPRAAKATMARQIVRLYWGERKAEAAEAAFDRLFRDKELPDNIPEVLLDSGDGASSRDIVSLLKDAGLAPSKAEARRLVEQGGVKIDRKRVTDLKAVVPLKNAVLVQCGKRKFARVRLRGSS